MDRRCVVLATTSPTKDTTAASGAAPAMAPLPGPGACVAGALLEYALKSHDAGLCVVPPMDNGSKRPAGGDWARWQLERPSREMIERSYAEGRSGIGYVCGRISGNLELFEFDEANAYH